MQIELEVVNHQADAVTTEATNFSIGANWDICDIQCKCDLLELGSSLQDEYASHLLSGKVFRSISILGIIPIYGK